MHIINESEITTSWKTINEMDEKKLESLENKLLKEQNNLLGFLMIYHKQLNEQERNLLIYLAIIVFSTLTQYNQIKEVSTDLLKERLKNNKSMIDYFNSENQSGQSFLIDTSLKNFSQPQLLWFIIQSLDIEKAKKNDDIADMTRGMILDNIREDMTGIIIYILKIFIECLHGNIK